MRRFATPLAPAGAGFAAFIAIYPPCNLRLAGDLDLVAPLRIHHGADDIITRPELCRAYVERLRRAGGDAEFFAYDGAHHGYDSAARMPQQRLAQLPNSSLCEYEERAAGAVVNTATGGPPRPDDACMRQGIEGGPHPAAGAATRERVAAYLRQLFELR